MGGWILGRVGERPVEDHSRSTYYKTIRPRVRLAIKMPIRVLIKIMVFLLKSQEDLQSLGVFLTIWQSQTGLVGGIASKDGRISASNSLGPPRVVSSKFLMNHRVFHSIWPSAYTHIIVQNNTKLTTSQRSHFVPTLRKIFVLCSPSLSRLRSLRAKGVREICLAAITCSPFLWAPLLFSLME